MLVLRLTLTAIVLSGCAAAAMADDRQPAEQASGVPSFELDVLPILTARGCNQGACHGKARGQNGFQLSLLAFDPDFDYSTTYV